MTFWKPMTLLTGRALIQFPRAPAVLAFSIIPPLAQFLLFGGMFNKLPQQVPAFPVTNYFTYLAPAIVFFVCVLGIANAGVALVVDFQSGYFEKLMLAPINMWSILLGRLFADGLRIYIQAGLMLALSLLFKAHVKTGLPGALLMLALGVFFAIFTVGVFVTNVALKTKDPQAVQAIFPVFFIIMFLTTAFLPKASIGSDLVKTIISGNPAEYVVRAMQDLMFVGYEWDHIGVAAIIIAAFAVGGVALTMFNFRSVYR